MNLAPTSQTAYDFPVVIAVNTSERMKPFEKEIFSCLVDILACIKDLQYMSNYDMPVVKGAILYNFFLGNYNEPERVVGRIVTKENDPEVMGFRNEYGKDIIGLTASGRKNIVKHGQVIPIIKGIKFLIDEQMIEIG